MSIYYDFHKQGGVFEGKDKVFVRVAHHQTVDTQKLFQKIEKASSLTRGDLKSALDAIAQAVSDELQMDNRVHLEGLGFFSLTMEAEVVEQENGTYKAKHPNIKNIHFSPEKPFLQQFANASFTAKRHTAPSPNMLSAEEAQAVIEKLFSEKPAFTVAQFAEVAQLQLRAAYPILQKLEDEGVIQNMGSSRRKIFVRP